MHDFEPYFCILDECDAPFNLPTTFDGLMGHLQDHHPKRYHVAISDVEERDFEDVEFEHFIKMNSEVSEKGLASLKKASQRRGVFLFSSCPFCGGYPDFLEKNFPDPTAEKAQIELRKHIKQHMQDIALFLPPYRDDISDNDDLESGVMGGRRHGSELTLLEDSDEWKSICDRSSCDCKEGEEEDYVYETFSVGDTDQIVTDENEDVDFWPQILADFSLYDRSAVADNYYHEDEKLRQLAKNYIIQELESDAPEREVVPAPVSEHLLGVNLLEASEQGDSLGVDQLLQQGADPNVTDKKGDTPLYYAARNGHETVARLLIANGADMDIPCRDSITPFWEAVYSAFKFSKRDSLARFLLKESLSKNYESRDQQACLIRAVCDGEVEEVNSLLQRGADPDLRDRWNVTPLFWAAFYGQSAVVELLIERNVDVNAANSDNRTPLFQASIRGLIEVAKLLIEKGADPQLQDRWGETALLWADRLQDDDILNVLNTTKDTVNAFNGIRNKLKSRRETRELRGKLLAVRTIATRVAPYHSGIELRFINATTTLAMSQPTLDQVGQIIRRNPFNGWREIGTSLKGKVLKEDVFRRLEENNLKRPVIVHLITAGKPSGPPESPESESSLKEVICECGKRLTEYGYNKDGMFAIM
ncbi:C2H2 type zinc finger domain protein [Penicillium herquei]|nr:C2H2 type zinc finger domain protein [Penicillium herquei]